MQQPAAGCLCPRSRHYNVGGVHSRSRHCPSVAQQPVAMNASHVANAFKHASAVPFSTALNQQLQQQQQMQVSVACQCTNHQQALTAVQPYNYPSILSLSHSCITNNHILGVQRQLHNLRAQYHCSRITCNATGNGTPKSNGNNDSSRRTPRPRQAVRSRTPSPPPDDSTQAGRLKLFMSKLGMMGVPGMGLAAGLPQTYSQSPDRPGNGNGNGTGPQDGNNDTAQRRKRITTENLDDWDSDWVEDWDPEEDMDLEARDALADQVEAEQRAQRVTSTGTPRDKWITPLLDFTSVAGAVDPDQQRTEDVLQSEALANKDESQIAVRYVMQIVTIPLITGFILSRALADPVLNFTLQNNADAFAMTDRQKIEGAEKVHIEEARLRFDMAIGKLPPLSEEQILEHLREFAEEVQEEERHHNEQNLITVVSDSISSIVLFSLISQQSRGRQALFNTLSRLFDGLSDIAKAVMIILIADTLLGYHSEEGWTGLIELLVGHYGFEAEEEALVIFVGVVPVVIDVFFKYWIFIGLNRISPGAVVTIKQIDTH